MVNDDLKEKRRRMFNEMEQKLKERMPVEEDRMFYYHSSEDRVVLSHSMFWTMTLPQFLVNDHFSVRSFKI